MKAFKCFKMLSAAAIFVMTAGAWAQDTAYVPFIVNVDAVVTAVQGNKSLTLEIMGGELDTMKLPLGSVSVRYISGARGMNAPAVTGSRGNITLRLPTQSYQNAEIALYSVNGKRILRGKAAAEQTANAIARKNLAAGAYTLSVKGINGNAFTTRLTHNGGKLNINAAFGESQNAARAKTLAKQAAAENWNITVSAEGYVTQTYTLPVNSGENDLQNITLIPESGGGGDTFVDERDDKTYRKVTIGTQTWMAENLNYDGTDVGTEIGVCYENSADSCGKYGRLYNWVTAMTLPSDCNSSSCSGQIQSKHQGVCPAGWHIPTNMEWGHLESSVGGELTAGTKLKSSTGWNSYREVPVGTNEYGFSALPGGDCYNGNFYGTGDYVYWWCAMEHKVYASQAYCMSLWYDNDYGGRTYESKAAFQFSVRCVQD